MSEELTLRLLGAPQVMLAGRPVTGFISAKTQALLFYVAVAARPHNRDTLAGLLWGDMAEAQASKNLRNALSNLRTLVGAHLEITRETVTFNRATAYWLDVEQFLTMTTAPAKSLTTLHRAVELYQGDFLEGFYVGDALGMEEWISGQRSLLKGVMVQVLHTLVTRHLEREEYAQGIDYANRLLTLEPWRDETHRHLMMLLVKSRQRSAALAQYEICRQVLARELGVEPLPETTALYERIKAAAAPPPHNLPPQATPFVGREAELAHIAAFLNNPQAQLLTLIGPGGIGKTRLALQAALRCVDPETSLEPRFVHGVWFVSLTKEGVGSGESPLVTALSEALHLEPTTALAAQARLLSYVRDKDLLCVFDNFEPVLEEAQRVSDLVRLAPRLKLLVTSRVRLNLQEEWLLEVQGLAFPAEASASAEMPETYSAVQLFEQQARRVKAGFKLTAEVGPAVVRICQLVEGVPLGLELAASWLRVLTCAEIVPEIEKNLDFLATAAQNVPERHRSLRAVFNYSWDLLTPAEQTLFRELTVFHGGFEREAAAQVVGAALPALAGLVDKSLLRRAATGRYEIHDLLRQYAEEKLLADPLTTQRLRDAHCSYYAALLSKHQAQLKSEDAAQVLDVLHAERDNVRAAWNWALSQRKAAELDLFMGCL